MGSARRNEPTAKARSELVSLAPPLQFVVLRRKVNKRTRKLRSYGVAEAALTARRAMGRVSNCCRSSETPRRSASRPPGSGERSPLLENVGYWSRSLRHLPDIFSISASRLDYPIRFQSLERGFRTRRRCSSLQLFGFGAGVSVCYIARFGSGDFPVNGDQFREFEPKPRNDADLLPDSDFSFSRLSDADAGTVLSDVTAFRNETCDTPTERVLPNRFMVVMFGMFCSAISSEPRRSGPRSNG